MKHITVTAGLLLAMASSGMALGATVTIDDMVVKQGSDTAPVAISNVPGGFAQSSISGPPASIYGGTRIVQVNHVSGAGSTETYVDLSTPSTWQVANPPFSSGWGQIVWSGTGTIGAMSLPPLDLTNLQYFNIAQLGSDQDTSFYIRIFSDANHCSQATIATFAVLGDLQNQKVLPGSFAACSGSVGPANLAAIREIRIFFTAHDDIDTYLRGVTAVVGEPPQVQCDSKRINNQSSYVVVGPGPYNNLNVSFGASNTGGAGAKIDVTDQLPPGMSYVGPTSCTGGFALGEPTLSGSILKWSSSAYLAKGTSVSCSFLASLDTVALGESKTDIIKAGIQGGTLGPQECSASVTRPQNPTNIPTMSEWGMIVTALLLTVFGGLSLRKREGEG